MQRADFVLLLLKQFPQCLISHTVQAAIIDFNMIDFCQSLVQIVLRKQWIWIIPTGEVVCPKGKVTHNGQKVKVSISLFLPLTTRKTQKNAYVPIFSRSPA